MILCAHPPQQYLPMVLTLVIIQTCIDLLTSDKCLFYLLNDHDCFREQYYAVRTIRLYIYSLKEKEIPLAAKRQEAYWIWGAMKRLNQGLSCHFLLASIPSHDDFIMEFIINGLHSTNARSGTLAARIHNVSRLSCVMYLYAMILSMEH